MDIERKTGQKGLFFMSGGIEFVSLGYCSNDYLCKVDEIPLDHKVEAVSHLTQGGGPAATAAVAAARLGMNTAFVGVAGDDDSGKIILRDFAEEKVNTEYMKTRPGCSTSTAFCWVDKEGKRSIVWYRGNGADLAPEEIPEELIAGAKVLHLDGHQTAGAQTAAKLAKKHGVLVSIDAGTLRPGVRELLNDCDIVITSEFFARQLTGIEDYEKSLMELVKIGAEVTGITMGVKGSMCFDRKTGKIIRCPSFDIEVTDTTGAGDVFHSAFAVRYSETRDIFGSMRFASAVSALKCTKLGGRTGIPTRAQVNEFLAQHS